MRTSALLLALALVGGGTLQAQEPQDRDRGPADAKKNDVNIRGEVISLDSATRTIAVRVTVIPGHAGKETVMEYQAKDRAELAKFKVGDKVVGKVSQKGEAPPRFIDLKVGDDPNLKPGRAPGVGLDTTVKGEQIIPKADGRDSLGPPPVRDPGRTGETGVDTTRSKPAPQY